MWISAFYNENFHFKLYLLAVKLLLTALMSLYTSLSCRSLWVAATAVISYQMLSLIFLFGLLFFFIPGMLKLIVVYVTC